MAPFRRKQHERHGSHDPALVAALALCAQGGDNSPRTRSAGPHRHRAHRGRRHRSAPRADARKSAGQDPDPRPGRRHHHLRLARGLRISRPHGRRIAVSRRLECPAGGAALASAGQRHARHLAAAPDRAEQARSDALRPARRAVARQDRLQAATLAATPFNIGHIAIGVALGYLDFRFAAEAWQATRPKLAAWHASFNARPSVAANMPQEG